jgi:putative SOS response-associated peptidase YedK
VTTKPSFRSAFKKRRCLILAEGYYEWHTEGKLKQPFRFEIDGGKTLAFAGLWEWCERSTKDILRHVIAWQGQKNLTRESHEVQPWAIRRACPGARSASISGGRLYRGSREVG